MSIYTVSFIVVIVILIISWFYNIDVTGTVSLYELVVILEYIGTALGSWENFTCVLFIWGIFASDSESTMDSRLFERWKQGKAHKHHLQWLVLKCYCLQPNTYYCQRNLTSTGTSKMPTWLASWRKLNPDSVGSFFSPKEGVALITGKYYRSI